MAGAKSGTAPGEAGLSVAETTVLRCLAETRGATATHWLAKACGPATGTYKARSLLQGLARRGLVEPVRASVAGRIFWWKITEAGTAVI